MNYETIRSSTTASEMHRRALQALIEGKRPKAKFFALGGLAVVDPDNDHRALGADEAIALLASIAHSSNGEV